ncbi:MAG: hypothetical protein KME07_21110 [Pegethrix bostrychoides GSE-TBD4-15B]|jgi:hypothetical protein|uniref:Uncharacterized protein n=1 Tax=Pegethrix bostrychoides GSE-TBD4-15B TaxID=2839662 RepID=A0A951PEK8_9CYAN|nr:hypothetical protein [Pegethrix bostrychoides GSE-TBD4-15B]
MLIVLILNLLLAMLCWWGIWQIWRLRQTLARVSAQINWVEAQALQLQNLPSAMPIQRLQSLRRQYRQTILSLQQTRQLLGLLEWGRWLWQQSRAQGYTSQSHTSQVHTSQSHTSQPQKRQKREQF